jgi:hypothetical protein
VGSEQRIAGLVRYESSTDLGLFNRDFRFCPVNGHRQSVRPRPQSADIVAKVPKGAAANFPKNETAKIADQ